MKTVAPGGQFYLSETPGNMPGTDDPAEAHPWAFAQVERLGPEKRILSRAESNG